MLGPRLEAGVEGEVFPSGEQLQEGVLLRAEAQQSTAGRVAVAHHADAVDQRVTAARARPPRQQRQRRRLACKRRKGVSWGPEGGLCWSRR